MIYFVQNVENGRIKIGFTTKLRTRISSISNQGGFPVKLLGVIDGDGKAEKKLHRRFNACHYSHEWFNPSPELLKFIAEEAEQVEVDFSPAYKPGPGRDTFEKKHGERGVSFKLKLPKSQYEHLGRVATENDTSIADVIRALIDRARPQPPQPPQPPG